MMTFIHCTQCNGTDIELGNVHVDVTLSKSKHCDSCHNCDTQKQTHFFCSLACFHKYIAGSEHLFYWNDPPPSTTVPGQS